MVNWFRRARERIEVPRLTPRSEQRPAARVDLHLLTPARPAFLGQAARLQLTFFEALAAAASAAPSLRARQSLALAAGRALQKHTRLVAEIERDGADALEVMEPFERGAQDFHRVIRSGDWFESVLACYLAGGFIDDFFTALGGGLPGEAGARAVSIISSASERDGLADLIESAIDLNPRLSSRLALWGRRLVGDTMLVARSALVFGANHDSDEARIEPVFTELIASHTRRMDRLGLTA